MKKMLVTTDFSPNSKSGLRFAIQLASQHEYELTFLHVYYIMKPSSWHEKTFTEYEKRQVEKIQRDLNRLVDSVYKSMKISSSGNKCILLKSIHTDKGIREYAAKNKFSLICISTRGAGNIKKYFGTNTSNLITFSEIPVIAVPAKHRNTKINYILYASDLSNLEKEIKQVVNFAKPLKAQVELLHLNSPTEIITDTKIIETAVKKFSKYDVKLHLENCNLVETFILNIESAIAASKPSMLDMFTVKNRTFFQRLMKPSKTEEYSFNPKVPLLVFNKN
jgi:nucleotide-binding universal stress UspA family protein